MNNIRHRTQVGRPGITLAIAVAIAVLVGPARAGGGCDRSVLDLAAAHIDAMLGSVAASTRAVGEAFATFGDEVSGRFRPGEQMERQGQGNAGKGYEREELHGARPHQRETGRGRSQ